MNYLYSYYFIIIQRLTYMQDLGLSEWQSQSLVWSQDLEAVLHSVALFLLQHPAPSASALLRTRCFQPGPGSAAEPRLCLPEAQGHAAGTAPPPCQSLSLCCWAGSVTKLWLRPASRLAPPPWSKEVCWGQNIVINRYVRAEDDRMIGNQQNNHL